MVIFQSKLIKFFLAAFSFLFFTLVPAAEPDKLLVEDLKVGTGREAQKFRWLKVHYTGWLTNGKKFDSSLTRKTPFRFQMGVGQVIKGWDDGLKGMKPGGKRKLTVPSRLGYGNQAQGSIPANSTLIFEVELLEVE